MVMFNTETAWREKDKRIWDFVCSNFHNSWVLRVCWTLYIRLHIVDFTQLAQIWRTSALDDIYCLWYCCCCYVHWCSFDSYVHFLLHQAKIWATSTFTRNYLWLILSDIFTVATKKQERIQNALFWGEIKFVQSLWSLRLYWFGEIE